MFKSVRRILDWTGRFQKRLYLGFVVSFFVSILVAVPVMIAAYALNAVILDMRGVETLPQNFTWQVFGAIILLVLLRYGFSLIRVRLQESIGCQVVADERMAIGDIMKRVSLGYFSKNRTGDISAGLTTQMTFLEQAGMTLIDTLVNGYIQVIVLLVCLAFFSVPIALISLAGVVLSSFFLQRLKQISDKAFTIVHKVREDMAGAVIEYVRGMSVIKAFGKNGAALDNTGRAFEDARKTCISAEKMFAPIAGLQMFSLNASSAGIVLVSSLAALNEEMPLSYMLMMLIFSFTIFGTLEKVNNTAAVLGIIDTSLNNLEKLKQIKFIDRDGHDLKPESYAITFDKVSFAYGDVPVIRDVSFDIPEGMTTAIVGPSGSGKTTLCNLLARFYDVDQGNIRIGNRSIREFTCDSLLTNISMVFQNVYLFHDTINNNIRFGKPDATMDEIVKAAKQARCHEFIKALPQGYDTVVEEGGSSLSGGEKQRISIARAMLKDAPIVILDEATASIDPENEQLIQAALSALTYDKTIIIIAHRLATIQNADQIVVIDGGRIVQKGTHSSLMAEEGVYKRFTEIRQASESWIL